MDHLMYVSRRAKHTYNPHGDTDVHARMIRIIKELPNFV